MSRYFGYVLITFVDGSTQSVGGNKHRVHEGQLIITTESGYGENRDTQYFPLVNIKSYRWEDG